MKEIKTVENLEELYDFQNKISSPNIFQVDFITWEKSMFHDIDGEGRKLFKELHTKGAYINSKLVGYIQYGKTAFGFDENGEISSDISYTVIRSLYFYNQNGDAGRALLNDAMKGLGQTERIYAFFHYFGMSCYARHGKLFESYGYIANVLQEYGFKIEHENVYYSSKLSDTQNNAVQIHWHEPTKGRQQYCDFIIENTCVGGCEVHFLEQKEIAYLRWIFVNDNIQNQGIGSMCMSSLKSALYKKGIKELDTDTALNNVRAQHYYVKNNFKKEGITRSYFIDM